MLSKQRLGLNHSTARIVTGEGPKIFVRRLSKVPFDVEPGHGKITHRAMQVISSEKRPDVIIVTKISNNLGRVLSHVRRHLKNVSGPRPHHVSQCRWPLSPG